jgi:DNA-binding protein
MVERKDNTIFVGKKPNMSYVLALVMQFGDGQQTVHVKARGRSISKAVDISQILVNRYARDVKVASVQIGTEKVQGEGRELNVSSIVITLSK